MPRFEPKPHFLLVFALTLGCSSSSSSPEAEVDFGTDAELAVTVRWGVTDTVDFAGDGVGRLVVGLFARDPAQPNAGLPVAFRVLEDVDVISEPAVVTLSSVPPRSEPYFATAFLDDNNDAFRVLEDVDVISEPAALLCDRVSG